MLRPWTHTSDDSYIYQLSLVVATATVSFNSTPISCFVLITYYMFIRAKRVSNCYIPKKEIVRVF